MVIVNYNVKYFLEQCLYAVEKAVEGLAAEVLVVDNQSTDGSLAYLQPRFAFVQWIQSEANLGFGKACNLGLQKATGDYILFLNPDTLVAEDSFRTCLDFFEQHPDCGALGVQMIDGSGSFLKESKRSFPSPVTSFYKLSGLARLFPRSKVFGRYHLGHLSKEENHVVDVLAGAFMMVPRQVLTQTGAFDERFFMYGEDVDLSYRIQQTIAPATGRPYRNYYLAATTIIHFKGESTKRGSLNYVRLFYKAMSLFVHKHYGGTRASLFTASIELAIWLRALLTGLGNVVRWIGLPVIDALLILFSFWLAKQGWIHFVRPDLVYPEKLLAFAFPAFTLAYLLVAYYAGLYDRYYQLSNLIRATFIATVGLLALYALLPEQYRFSRAVVVLGAVAAFILIAGLRWVAIRSGWLKARATASHQPYLLAAASARNYQELLHFLAQQGLQKKLIGRVAIDANEQKAVAALPLPKQIGRLLHASELIFCAGDLSYTRIIEELKQGHPVLRFRFHAAGSGSVVGSDDSTSSGEIIGTHHRFALAAAGSRRTKRLIDVLTALLLLLSFPVHLLWQQNRVRFFENCFAVLAGRRTWVGYKYGGEGLPRLRKAIVAPNGLALNGANPLPEETWRQIDFWYAKSWTGWEEIKTLFRAYSNMNN